MSQQTISEARANLRELIEVVERGQSVELTRRGRSVAVMISIEEYERLTGKSISFGDAYRRFLTEFELSEDGLESDELDNLRSKDLGRAVEL